MPLDPFFDERLRVHRKYLFDQALRHDARADSRRSAVLARRPAMPAAARAEATTAQPKRRASASLGPRARARARHRRAALAWDRSELDDRRHPGPDVRTAEHRSRGRRASRRSACASTTPTTSATRRCPRCLAFFGGAFRIGGIDYPTTDAAYRRRAVDAQVAIVAVDYALAPEHRYPVQVEQAYAALEWLFEHAAELGIDPDRIGVLGTSAGGNLAAAVTLMNRDRAGLPLRLQVLEVPVVDLTGRPPRPARDAGPRHPSRSRAARAALGGAHLPAEPARTRSSPTRRRCAPHRTRAFRRR